MPEFKAGLYKHYKGGLYRALFLATHHETEKQFVVYVALAYPESGVRVRELEDWNAEITETRYRMDGGDTYELHQHRFERISD